MTQDAGRLQLYLTHRAALIDYATPILGERARAEDVVQEAFLRFVPPADGAAAMARIEQPASYLYRIVRNLAFDIVRRRRTEDRVDGSSEWWMLPPAVRTPEQEMIHRQNVERVEAVLANLPARDRLAVEMKRFGGYTLQEIADRLGISVPTAHRAVRDGLLRIASAMTETAHDAP